MKISVIIPCFNAQKTIERAINSILEQEKTFDLEIIIIDDNSEDNTIAIIEKKYQGYSSIKLIKNDKNRGPSFCRNKGLEIFEGDFVAFLDADDFWLPKKLEKQIQFMVDKNISYSYHDYYELIEDNNGNFISCYQIQSPQKAEMPSFLYKRNFGMCLTTMISKEIASKYRFPENPKISTEDYYFFLQIVNDRFFGMRIPENLAVYCKQEKSRSSNKIRQAFSVYQCNKAICKNQKFKNFIYFLMYATFSLLKKKSVKSKISNIFKK